MIWLIGVSCDIDGRFVFDVFLRIVVLGRNEEVLMLVFISKWECLFDEKGLVYDYMYEV